LEAPKYRLNTGLLALPARPLLAQTLGESAKELCRQADEVAAGRMRLFGGALQPLDFDPHGPREHWSAYETGQAQISGVEDIKLIWEPARFGWAFILGRAYHLSGEERYTQAFWGYTEAFLQANPPNQGPNWLSAQEVALRLIALAFAAQVFSNSPLSTSERLGRLGQALAAHAARLPLTLVYARAQNNNHLLSEAAGLYTAGRLLPEHPSARRWQEMGWRWFQQGLQAQIDPDGAYIQHSANYQRLMLHLALWVQALAAPQGQAFPPPVRQKLGAATLWLRRLMDPISGRLPNLGPNDGAYILPLDTRPFADYRPALQAASLAFLDELPFEPGAWDETRLWLFGAESLPSHSPQKSNHPQQVETKRPLILRSPASQSWAYLRLAQFQSRPGHADQLHLDLWWRGVNLAQDAGTYLYNAPPPWENALAHASVHNTITVDDQDQMRRAGRFLYLDWAQGRLLAHTFAEDGSWEQVVAEHNGYRRLGVNHRRTVRAAAGGLWRITDQLLASDPPSSEPGALHNARLHWLLPNWDWKLDGNTLHLYSPFGIVSLELSAEGEQLEHSSKPQLARAGELLTGSGEVEPAWGWVSPTYTEKQPALSFSLQAFGRLPFSLVSRWTLPLET
jgi:hypothetical protein